ncbi:MAG: hypothetical protein KGJ66_15080, partial [Alphaproteobacteria bacterium]|nr:hypothetical protein [Alphaproteobacteria bacterium]
VFTGSDRKEHRIRVSGTLRANNSGALVAAAMAGQGLIVEQTCTVGPALNAGRLVPVLTDYALPEVAIHALYPHNRYLSAKVRTFVDFLLARFGQNPDWDEWRRSAPRDPRPSDDKPLIEEQGAAQPRLSGRMVGHPGGAAA